MMHIQNKLLSFKSNFERKVLKFIFLKNNEYVRQGENQDEKQYRHFSN